MSISVCMATYNGEKYIGEQINSILYQISEEDELVISDDHSTDNTINVIKAINDSRIKIFFNNGENGYTRNFENALKHTTGDIIFLSDQDDVWIEGKVKAILEKLEKCQFVVTDAEIVDRELKTLNKSHFELTSVKKGFINNFGKTRYIGACMAFKRSVLNKALPFPKNQKLCAHDYWIAIVSELYFKTELIEIPYLKYRRHSSNASSGGLQKSDAGLLKKLVKRLYCGCCLIKIILKK